MPFSELFADSFLGVLGASEIVSVDRSDFEGATLLHDLNNPFPELYRGSFDLVIDGGTLEHIFDYPRALANCLDLLRDGGHIVTITPASGQMGHGFYQFSPELFFRAFSKERGFQLRKIIGYDISRLDSPFYDITEPATTHHRTHSVGGMPLQLIVLAQKIIVGSIPTEPPQQSDYAAIWKEHEQRTATNSPNEAAQPGILRRLRNSANHYWPAWLRELRNSSTYRYRWMVSKLKATFTRTQQFRRLSNKEIYAERSAGIIP